MVSFWSQELWSKGRAPRNRRWSLLQSLEINGKQGCSTAFLSNNSGRSGRFSRSSGASNSNIATPNRLQRNASRWQSGLPNQTMKLSFCYLPSAITYRNHECWLSLGLVWLGIWNQGCPWHIILAIQDPMGIERRRFAAGPGHPSWPPGKTPN